jgi:hypothetical protein
MEDPKPLEVVNDVVYYTAKAEDQGHALDECVKWAIDKFVLMSIVWQKLDENGKNVFAISYASQIDVPAQSGNPDLPKSD